MNTLSEVVSVTAGYGSTPVLRDVSWAVRPNEAWAVLGPNGAGKTTLARVLAGLLQPTSGHVVIGGMKGPLSPAMVAQQVSWVPQSMPDELEFSALEVALFGRAPKNGWWGLPGRHDEALAREALAAFDVGHLADRAAATLSGGERRRVFLARAMVQATPLVVLDEPTAFLDVKHQVETLARVRTWASEKRAVVAVLHDVTLAARFATHVALVEGGAVIAQGPAREVLTAERLSRVYGTEMVEVPSVGFVPRWPAP